MKLPSPSNLAPVPRGRTARGAVSCGLPLPLDLCPALVAAPLHLRPSLPAHLPLPLALADGMTVALALFQLVFSAVVSVALWKLTTWQRRYEGLEDRLHQTTTKLIEERFRAMTHELNAHVQSFVLTLEEMRQRIQSGDAEVRGLGERDQKIELAVAARLDTLKDYIRDHTANKKDMEKHEASVERKLGTIEARLSDLGAGVAVLGEKVKERTED